MFTVSVIGSRPRLERDLEEVGTLNTTFQHLPTRSGASISDSTLPCPVQYAATSLEPIKPEGLLAPLSSPQTWPKQQW